MAFRGYIGDYGAGKTYCMVADAFHARSKGRPVFANIELRDLRVKRDRWTGRWSAVDPATFGKTWSSGIVRTWDEVRRLDNAVVLIDEIGRWAGSTDWAKFAKNAKVVGWLHQQRKWGIDIWYTSQLNGMVHNQIRDLTAETWACTRHASVITQELIDFRQSGPRGPVKMQKKVRRISPAVFDLYDTLEMVGDGETGEGYGRGVRAQYGGLREEQRAVLIRHFGPEALGIYREEGYYGTRYSYAK